MKKPIRNRIVEHVQVRAGELLPHPLNYRRHPDQQRAALVASYEEVGFSRSLLGYRLPDDRIQLIDGHLRRDLDPDMVVTVEVLDVGDEEARKLLLTIDPLAALAETDREVLAQLAAATEADSEVLNDLWRTLADGEAVVADLQNQTRLEEMPTQPPPTVVWVLLGIPASSFGQVQHHLAALEEVAGVTVQSHQD